MPFRFIMRNERVFRRHITIIMEELQTASRFLREDAALQELTESQLRDRMVNRARALEAIINDYM